MLKSAKDIRREKFTAEVNKAGGVKQFVELYSENPDYVRQLISGKTPMGHRAARRLEGVLGKPANWLDAGAVDTHAKQDKEAPHEPAKDTSTIAIEKRLDAIRATLTSLTAAVIGNSPTQAAIFSALLSESARRAGLAKDEGVIADALEIAREVRNVAGSATQRA